MCFKPNRDVFLTLTRWIFSCLHLTRAQAQYCDCREKGNSTEAEAKLQHEETSSLNSSVVLQKSTYPTFILAIGVALLCSPGFTSLPHYSFSPRFALQVKRCNYVKSELLAAKRMNAVVVTVFTSQQFKTGSPQTVFTTTSLPAGGLLSQGEESSAVLIQVFQRSLRNRVYVSIQRRRQSLAGTNQKPLLFS